MPLTEEQWTKLYDASIANATDIEWIRNTLEETTTNVNDCNGRLRNVEIEQGFTRGRLVRFSGSIAIICTIAVNGILWAFARFGGNI